MSVDGCSFLSISLTHYHVFDLCSIYAYLLARIGAFTRLALELRRDGGEEVVMSATHRVLDPDGNIEPRTLHEVGAIRRQRCEERISW